MRCKSPIRIENQVFNCGRCVACRINYTQEWALRLQYELPVHDYKASFLTLTYNNENLPLDYALHKEDLQKFFKRLRINLQREYREFAPKLRYYAVGEFGSEQEIYYTPGAKKPHGRPHFHAIVFGLDNYNDKHREILKKSWDKCESWLFDKDRGKNSGMQEVTPDDIAYVTGYVQKKLSGNPAVEKYGISTPPFSVCSQGLGLDFALDNKKRLIENGWTFYKNHKVSIPRYFCKKFDISKANYINKNNELNRINELWEIFAKEEHEAIKDPVTAVRQFDYWRKLRESKIAEIASNDLIQRKKLIGAKL